MEKKEGVIRLLNSSGTSVMDSVSVEYEDSFCLDTFGELIEQHQNSEPKGTKNFIIARVQTWDHKQPEKAYYSYYNAFQLNKILFQTQIYLGKKLIHRLRVLNPLTNTDIIGNVNYFMVKGKASELKKENSDEVKINIGEADINNGKTSDMGHDKEECLKTVSLKEVEENNIPKLTIETAKDMEKSIQPKTDENKLSALPKKKKDLPKINTSLTSPIEEIIPPSPSVLANEKGGVGSWTIASPAVYECKDEDISKKLFKKKGFSLLTPSKTQFNKPKNTPLSNIPENENEYGSTVIMIQPQEKQIEVGSSNQPTLEHTEITSIPVGTVTQFAKPVPEDQVLKIIPPTIKGRRRSLSYLNTLSATPTNNCSLREWLVYMKKESMKLDEEKDDNNEKKDYDTINLEKEKPKEEEEDISNSKPNNEEETKKDDTDVSDIDIEIYDAVLFATDDDFLEKSKIRAIFKKNAVTPEDAKLFEMPEYKGASSDEAQLILYDDATICDICFPEPPSNITGFRAILYQYRYILIMIIIISMLIPIFLI